MNQKIEKVCVIGLGYVGLPTAAVIASRGLKVTGVDTNGTAVDLINQGKVHIVEPDLDILVNGAVARGLLNAVGAPEEADAFIIAVPTPFTDGHKPDLRHLEKAARDIAPVLRKGNLVVIESTSPVGTTDTFSQWLSEQRGDLSFPHQAGHDADIQIAHSPERVLPGSVLLEMVRNDRVVGGITAHCAQRAAELYDLFVDGECHLTDARTAELVKLSENAYRDVNIAFANELSLVCDKLDIDVWDVVDLANRHPRVNILNPGPGVGGHCIAVDPWFIVDSAPDETPLIQAARKINDGKPAHIANRVREAADELGSPAIACLGLSYKANIDDLRESPAIEVVKHIAAWKDSLLVVEPNVSGLPESLRETGGIKQVPLEEALEAADILVLLVDHKEFHTIKASSLDGKTVIDTRGVWREI